MADNEQKANKNNELTSGAGGTSAGKAGATPNPNAEKLAAQEPIDKAQNKVSTHPNYDGLAISEKLPVLFLEPLNDSATKLRTRFSSDEQIKVLDVKINTAPLVGRQMSPCLMVACILQNQDVVKLLNLLKMIRDEVRANRIKFIILSKITNPAIVGSFESMGCHEYIVEPISERSLMFKMDLQTKALKSNRKRARQEELKRIDYDKSDRLKNKDRKAEDQNNEDEDSKSRQIKENEEIEDDVWVFKGSKPKKQGGKWTMRMKGPDPSKGNWVQVEKTDEQAGKWRFMESGTSESQDKKGSEGKNKNAWEWSGDKPSFNNGEWSFQSEKPELSLVDDKGSKKGSKVALDKDGGLALAKDSQDALKKVEEQEKEYENEKDKKKKAFLSRTGAGENEGDAEIKKGNLDFRDFGMEEDPAKHKDYHPEKKQDGKEEEKKKKLDFRDFAIQDSEDNSKAEKNKKTIESKTKSSFKNISVFENEEPRSEFNDKTQSNDGEQNEKDNKQDKPGLSKGLKKPNPFASESTETTESNAEPLKELNPQQKNFLGNNKKKTNPFAPKEGMDEEENKSTGAEKKRENPFKRSQDKAEKSKDEVKNKKPGFAEEKGGFSSKLDEKQPEKKSVKNNLAEMAMIFEEEKKDYEGNIDDTSTPSEFNDKLGDEKKADAVKDSRQQSSEKPKEKINPFKPDSKSKNKELERAALAEAKKKANPFAPKSKASEGEDGNSDDKAEDLSENQRNFLGKKKPVPKASLEHEEEQGGWSRHKSEGDAKKQKWKGHDSNSEEEQKPDEDKLIEIESPSGELNVKEPSPNDIFEYPDSHFGLETGVWEPTGEDPADPKNRKVYVYVVPDVRARKYKDFKSIKVWWIFRGMKPAYTPTKKVWVCRQYHPEKFESFELLPENVKKHLLTFLPAEARKKVAEEVLSDSSKKDQVKGKEQSDQAAKKDRKSALTIKDAELGIEGAPGKEKAEEAAKAEASDILKADPVNKGAQKKDRKSALTIKDAELGIEGAPGKEKAEEAAKAEASDVLNADPVNKGAQKKDRKSALTIKDVEMAIDQPESKVVKNAPLKPRPLPAAPMVAMISAEILMRSKGDVSLSLNNFASFLSEILNLAKVTIFCLHKANAEKGERLVRVVAGNDSGYPIESEMSVTDKPDFMNCIDACAEVVSKDAAPTLYFPVYVSVAANAPKLTVGLLVVRTHDVVAPLNIEFLKKYLKGVSQCLRGQLVSLQDKIVKVNAKEAA